MQDCCPGHVSRFQAGTSTIGYKDMIPIAQVNYKIFNLLFKQIYLMLCLSFSCSHKHTYDFVKYSLKRSSYQTGHTFRLEGITRAV